MADSAKITITHKLDSSFIEAAKAAKELSDNTEDTGEALELAERRADRFKNKFEEAKETSEKQLDVIKQQNAAYTEQGKILKSIYRALSKSGKGITFKELQDYTKLQEVHKKLEKSYKSQNKQLESANAKRDRAAKQSKRRLEMVKETKDKLKGEREATKALRDENKKLYDDKKESNRIIYDKNKAIREQVRLYDRLEHKLERQQDLQKKKDETSKKEIAKQKEEKREAQRRAQKAEREVGKYKDADFKGKQRYNNAKTQVELTKATLNLARAESTEIQKQNRLLSFQQKIKKDLNNAKRNAQVLAFGLDEWQNALSGKRDSLSPLNTSAMKMGRSFGAFKEYANNLSQMNTVGLEKTFALRMDRFIKDAIEFRKEWIKANDESYKNGADIREIGEDVKKAGVYASRLGTYFGQGASALGAMRGAATTLRDAMYNIARSTAQIVSNLTSSRLRQAFDQYSKLELSNIGFENFFKNEAPASIQQKIRQAAVESPMNASDLADYLRQVAPLTSNSDQALNGVMGMAKLISYSGGDISTEMNYVIKNIRDVLAKGKANTIDIRQFNRAMPALTKVFEEMGMSEFLKNGELTITTENANKLLDAFAKAGDYGDVGGIFGKTSQTFSGMLQKIDEQIDFLIIDAFEASGALEAIRGVLSNLADDKSGFIHFAKQFTQLKLHNLTLWAKSFNWEKLFESISAGVRILADALRDAKNIILDSVGNGAGLKDTLGRVISVIGDFIRGLSRGAAQIIDIINAIHDSPLGAILSPVLSVGAMGMGWLASPAGSMMTGLLRFISNVSSGAGGILNNVGTSMANFGKKLMELRLNSANFANALETARGTIAGFDASLEKVMITLEEGQALAAKRVREAENEIDAADELVFAKKEEAVATKEATTSEKAETAANTEAAASEKAETTANAEAAASETVEVKANVAAASAEEAETTANMAAIASEQAETAANIASAASEQAEAGANLAAAGAASAGAGASIGGMIGEFMHGPAATFFSKAGTALMGALLANMAGQIVGGGVGAITKNDILGDNIGSIIGNIGGGAAIGLSFGGPWGAAAGALIGSIKSIFDVVSRIEKVKHEEAEVAAKNLALNVRSGKQVDFLTRGSSMISGDIDDLNVFAQQEVDKLMSLDMTSMSSEEIQKEIERVTKLINERVQQDRLKSEQEYAENAKILRGLIQSGDYTKANQYSNFLKTEKGWSAWDLFRVSYGMSDDAESQADIILKSANLNYKGEDLTYSVYMGVKKAAEENPEDPAILAEYQMLRTQIVNKLSEVFLAYAQNNRQDLSDKEKVMWANRTADTFMKAAIEMEMNPEGKELLNILGEYQDDEGGFKFPIDMSVTKETFDSLDEAKKKFSGLNGVVGLLDVNVRALYRNMSLSLSEALALQRTINEHNGRLPAPYLPLSDPSWRNRKAAPPISSGSSSNGNSSPTPNKHGINRRPDIRNGGYYRGGVVYRAAGGDIPTRGVDTVPAMLQPGEFVVRKSTVGKIGLSALNALNTGDVGYFAEAIGRHNVRNDYNYSRNYSRNSYDNRRNTNNVIRIVNKNKASRLNSYYALANRLS